MKYTLKLTKLESTLIGLFSGVLMYLSFPNDFPGIHLGFLAFIAFAPLSIIYLSQNKKNIFLATLAFSFSFYYPFLTWLGRFDPPGLPIPVLLPLITIALSMYYFLTAVVYRKLAHTFPAFKVILLPLTFLTLEYIRNVGFLKFPYGILAYSQYDFLALIQIIDITGYLGISLLLYTINAYIADFFLVYVFNKNKKPFFIKKSSYFINRFTISIYIILILSAYGIFKINRNETKPKISVTLIQPWWDYNLKYNRQNREKVKKRLFTLIDKSLLARDKTDLFVLPESAVNTFYRFYLTQSNRIPQILNKTKNNIPLNEREYRILETWQFKKFFQSKQSHILFGTAGLKEITNSETLVANNSQKTNTSFKAAKTKITHRTKKKYILYNKAISLNENGEIVDTYAKHNLVPVAEWFPYKKLLEFLPLLKQILESTGASDFRPGEKLTIFKHPKFNFSVLVCYDDCFDNISREMVNFGSEVLIVITNDAWSYSASSEINHYILSIFRAIENRRPVIRSANAGVTCHIDKNGKTVEQLPLFEENYLNIKIDPGKEKTIYSYIGSYLFLPIVIAIFLLLILSFFLKKPMDHIKIKFHKKK